MSRLRELWNHLATAAEVTVDRASQVASAVVDAVEQRAADEYRLAAQLGSEAHDAMTEAAEQGPAAVVNLPGRAIHAVAEAQNEREQEDVQAAVDLAQDRGLISEDTAQTITDVEQVVQGVREAAADVAAGLMKKGTAEDLGNAMGDAYTQAGGGADGVLSAVNVLNPAYHALVAGYEASEAVERGDYREAGRQGTHAAVGVVATAAIAVGGAELAVGRIAGEAGVAG